MILKEVLLRQMVDDYLAHYQAEFLAHLNWYAPAYQFDIIIERVSKAEDSGGLRHSHQRRLPSSAISEVFEVLKENKAFWHGANDFSHLFKKLEALLLPLSDVGPLMVYDTALRLGAHKKFSPDCVYLQCGSKRGAKSFAHLFGRNTPNPFPRCLPRHFFGPELNRLSPAEIENFLCIFAGQLEQSPTNS